MEPYYQNTFEKKSIPGYQNTQSNFYRNNISPEMNLKKNDTYWYILIALIIIILVSILSVVIYLAVKKDSKTNSVKVIDNNHSLSEDDLEKHLLVTSKDVTVTVPRNSTDWNGVVRVENFYDMVNSMKIDTGSNIRITEYSQDVIAYPPEIDLVGKLHVYENKTGSVDLINYSAEIKFSNRITSIDIRTIIADKISFS